jgi:hypothetical protein
MDAYLLPKHLLGLAGFRRGTSEIVLSSAALLFFGVGAYALPLPHVDTTSTGKQPAESSLVHSVRCTVIGGAKICDNRMDTVKVLKEQRRRVGRQQRIEAHRKARAKKGPKAPDLSVIPQAAS